ncbi:permease-like cell division protein FtsX [Haloimpatiens sp. FM7330]|uniref:permease-like cell division protein FtsX n=1 Tax=Haloimpatiens sp. FM7330 TaxID=3298610 RepID=UPI00363B9F3F
MKISSLKYFIVDALKSIKRNRTVSIASMITVAAALFLMGVFLLAILNVGQGVKSVESKVEVQVFVKDNIKIDEKKDLEKTIKNIDGVKELVYRSKEDALKKWKEQLGEQNESLSQGLDKENPLPSSYIIKVEKPEIVSKIVSTIKDKPGIDQIKDGRKVVDKIITITNILKWIGIALFLICLVVSLFLIGNTIKLTVFSRRREITIMKYVGATDWFIRWPFIIEGMIIGILGGVFATIVLYYLYKLFYARIYTGMMSMLMQVIPPQYIVNALGWKFILGGILIGSLGSVLSIRKFLKV